MTFLIPIILAAAAPLSDSGTVSSSNASYDGNALVLKGQVVLDHGLGKMKADEAILQRQEAGKDFPFSLIHLQSGVLISLKNNAAVQCETADLDFVALKGTLLSPDRVVYSDTVQRKKGEGVPFKLAGKAVDLQFSKKGESGQKIDYEIDAVVANDAVQIDYLSGFTVHADHAVYRKAQGTASPEAPFESHVTAASLSDAASCRLVHGGDVIDSKEIQLDLLRSKLAMSQPKGVVRSLLDGELHFTSDSLLWDHPKNTVALRGRVHVQEPSLGTIASEEEIQLVHGKKGQLSAIRTKGKTTVEYLNQHKLVCYGPLYLDRTKLSATIDSPSTQGAVPEGKQIYYEEGEMAVWGDKAQIEYSLEGGSFQPVSISLKGHVRLADEGSKKCGVADRLTFSPQTRTFILGANPGRKVLFANEEENLRISAQEVHITEDPMTKKQSVKGIGTVQMVFSTEELETIQKLSKISQRLQYQP